MGTSQIDKIFPLLMDTENIKKMQLSDLMRRLKAYPPQEFEFRLAVCSRLLKLYQMKTRIVNTEQIPCLNENEPICKKK